MPTDEIITDFDNFITEICGEPCVSEKAEKRYQRYPERRDIDDYRYQKQDNLAHCSCKHYKCSCGEHYEIYAKPTIVDDYDRYNPDNPYMTIQLKTERYFCIICGEPFYINGTARFIRNVGSTITTEIIRSKVENNMTTQGNYGTF